MRAKSEELGHTETKAKTRQIYEEVWRMCVGEAAAIGSDEESIGDCITSFRG